MWCPKCKTEYQPGIRVCADCGSELVEEQPKEEKKKTGFLLQEEEIQQAQLEALQQVQALQRAKALQQAQSLQQEEGLQQAEALQREEGLQQTEALQKEEGLQQAKALQKEAGLQQAESLQQEEGLQQAEAQQQKEGLRQAETLAAQNQQTGGPDAGTGGEEEDAWASALEGQEGEEAEEEDFQPEQMTLDEETAGLLHGSDRKEYVKKADRYRDLKTSGMTFLIFGIIGEIYLLLTKLEIIPIQYALFVFLAMAALFLGFAGYGVAALVKSTSVKKEIPREEARTIEIMQWLGENVTEEKAAEWVEPELSVTENDLALPVKIKGVLLKNFPEENPSYLDMLAEEYYEKEIQEGFWERNQEPTA